MKIKNFYNLLSTCIFLISILLLVFTFYRSEIIYNGVIREKYYIYYIISILISFFSIITFYLKHQKRGNIFLLFFSIIFTFYLIEILFQFVGENKIKTISKRINFNKDNTNQINIDKRSRYEFYLDQKKINKNVVLSITPNIFLSESELSFLPLSGISNRETIMCNENGYYVMYNSDRYGFNNQDEMWDNEIIDFVFIGDSYTHGACVNRSDTMSGNLREISNKSVLNLGMAGSGPLLEYAIFKEYSINLNIKNLLLIFNSSDLVDLEIEKKNLILQKYINEKDYYQNLKTKQENIDKFLIDFMHKKTIKLENRKFDFIKLTKTRSLISKVFKSNKRSDINKYQDYEMFSKIIKKIKNYSISNEINFVIVYLPSHPDLIYEKKIIKKQSSFLKNISDEMNITFIDVNEEIFKKYDNLNALLSYYVPYHINEKAYKMIAELILSKINVK
tara:strand:- start:803 stop:2146 length:1344 start_codon:yes stop_codon:yes gene_type:complete